MLACLLPAFSEGQDGRQRTAAILACQGSLKEIPDVRPTGLVPLGATAAGVPRSTDAEVDR